ncbi:MAG: nuclear transport factor 2 family protein [Maribacter sp.]|nr:nuclear transport factor 2 family protein [Maribacter sp.]
MKNTCLLILALCLTSSVLSGQQAVKEQAIRTLIDEYAQARETKDTVLLRKILTNEIDQLVSSGVWRKGFSESKKGMLQSSTQNRGSRTLTIESIRFLHQTVALVDCRYTIQRPNGSTRKMWSSFTMQKEGNQWKIAAIRNMLPAGSPK